jgi:hypothetical protein
MVSMTAACSRIVSPDNGTHPLATTPSEAVIWTSGRVDLRLDRPLRHAQGKQRELQRYSYIEATILNFEEVGCWILL